MPRIVEAYDEPFGNNSALGTYLCARLAREHGVRRLLAGDGGDEIFGGNERYASDRVFAVYGRMPQALRRSLIEPALAVLPGERGILEKARRYVKRASLPMPRRLYSYDFYFASEGRELLGDRLAGCDPDGPGARSRGISPRRPPRPISTAPCTWTSRSPWGQRPRQGDPHGGARGYRVRFPLLDRPLVEFTATLPASFKVRGLEKRYLFKRAFGRCSPQRSLPSGSTGSAFPPATGSRERGLPRAGARSLALAVGPRARLLPGGRHRAPRDAPRVRLDALLRRSSVDGADAPPLASPALEGRPL
jgi:asparagine synthase (glutamine-hydrolysing)